MSFQEKSTALMLALLVAIYGWYFTTVAPGQPSRRSRKSTINRWMPVTVGVLVVLAIVGHIEIAVIPPYEKGDADERGRIVDLGVSGSVGSLSVLRLWSGCSWRWRSSTPFG